MERGTEMKDSGQLSLFDLDDNSTEKQVHSYIVDLLKQNRMPSAFELIREAEMRFGWKIRWDLCQYIESLISTQSLTRYEKTYLSELIDSESEYGIMKGAFAFFIKKCLAYSE
jgi:hypothetical protein